MKLRFPGFHLVLGKGLSKADFFTALASHSGKVFKFQGSARLLTVVDHGKHIIGSLWTRKGITKLTEMDEKSFKMSVRSLDPGKALGVFNFFVLSKRNLNGLFSFYKNSASPEKFGAMLRSFAKPIVQAKMKAALQALPKGERTKERTAQIRSEYSVPLEWSLLYTQSKLPQILKNWERIRSLTHRITKLQPYSSELRGLKPYVLTRTTELSFDKDAKKTSLISSILDYFKSLVFDSARIQGVDDSGADRRIDVIRTPDWFGEYDYNDMLSDDSLFADNVLDSCLTKAMLQEVRDRPEYFDIDVK